MSSPDVPTDHAERRLLAWALTASDQPDLAIYSQAHPDAEQVKWLAKFASEIDELLRVIAPTTWATEAFQLRFFNGDDPADVAAIFDDEAVTPELVASATDAMMRSFVDALANGQVGDRPVANSRPAVESWCRSLFEEIRDLRAEQGRDLAARIGHRTLPPPSTAFLTAERQESADSADHPVSAGPLAAVRRYVSEILSDLPRLAWESQVVAVGVRSDNAESERWSSASGKDAGEFVVHLVRSQPSLIADITSPLFSDRATLIVAAADENEQVHLGVGEMVDGYGTASIDWPGGRPVRVAVAIVERS